MKYFIVKGTGAYKDWFYLVSKKSIKSETELQEIRKRQEELQMPQHIIDSWIERLTYEVIAEVTVDRQNWIATEKVSGQCWNYSPWAQNQAFKQSNK